MKNKRIGHCRKDEYRFNLEIYKSGSVKEFKITNASISSIDTVVSELKKKYL